VLIIFNKPFGVLCQFTGEGLTLKEYINVPGIYAAGRLDKDSEGLLVLTDDGRLQNGLTDPKHGKHKVYWVQVDGAIDQKACYRLEQGVILNDGKARVVQCRLIDPPALPERDPPIRFRKNTPTSWIEMTLDEGRNRQVRRMTAAVGFPTLRLVRTTIGDHQLGDLSPGEYRVIDSTRVESAHAKQRHPSHRRNVRRR
jgi:23S rRNA pseudouridine2457 synthase